MAVCRATKRDGEPCTLPAAGSGGFCWAHDPANAAKRSRMASKAAKSRGGTPGAEVEDLKRQLQALADRVIGETVPSKNAAVAVQCLNVKLRALELQRRWHETEELEGRIEALEQRRGIA